MRRWGPRNAEYIAQRDELRRRIVEAVLAHRELYSAEVADLVGIEPHEAKAHLVRLEKLGQLRSRYAPAEEGSGSGLGRRYYSAPGAGPKRTPHALSAPGAESTSTEVAT